MRRWNTGIPQPSMHPMVHTWFPTWLNPMRPNKTVYTLVDHIRYEELGPIIAN